MTVVAVRLRPGGNAQSSAPAAGSHARAALAVEDEFAPAESEPRRREGRQAFGAAGDLEDLAAVLAAEVVMVVLGRLLALVAGRLAGELDRDHGPVFNERRFRTR